MIYYVKNSGNDANDGLSDETAFASTAKVNEVIKGGDTIKFRCGDTFYGSIKAVPNDDANSPKIFEAYGDGAKPIISLYKIAIPTAWEKAEKNVWRIDLTDNSKYIGNIYHMSANVGFLKVNGEIFGRKLFDLDDLHTNWDFYNDSQYVYVYSEKSPAGYDVKIACDAIGIGLSDNMAISDLEIIGSGGHGIRGSAKNAVIQNCDIHEIGGAYLPHHIANTRYGNGIEIWSDSANINVKNNRIYDVYDVAVTMQGNEVKFGWENIVISDNMMWNNEQSFEVWSHGDVGGFENCRFENNVCINAGFGWSHNVRPDRAVAVHLLIYDLMCPVTNITVENNVFYNGRGGLYSKTGKAYEIPKGYRSDRNIIFLRAEQEISVSGLRFTTEWHTDFSRYFKRESNSEFNVVANGTSVVTDALITELWRMNH